VREDQQRECRHGRRQQMYCADSQDVELEAAADILPQQKTNPADDDEENQPARVAARHNMECQPIHGGDDTGKCEYGVGHGVCTSRVNW